ncbi:MAG: hypothetical protein WA771_04625 [Chthoniobacterales bacterium]
MLRAVSILLTTLAITFTSHAQSVTLLEAIAVLPPEYRNGILKVSADEANPNPSTWYFQARNAAKASDVYSLEVTDGALDVEKPSFNLSILLGQTTPIDVSRLELDTPGLWRVISANTASSGRGVYSASYKLSQTGDNAAPVWQVWCYDSNGDEIAELNVLATTGAVTSIR